MTVERESIEFDVLIVGGGPAGLAGAIRLMQLARDKSLELEVALIEKGAEIGSHAISGAILKPQSLAELIPDHLDRGCPIETTVRGDEFYYLTRERALCLPMTPKYLHNRGSYVISASQLCRWLGGIAEELGVNIFPGFDGQQVLYGADDHTIIGVRTGDKGLNKDGGSKANFEPGIDLLAKATIFAEGARGSLVKSMTQCLGLSAGKQSDVYEVGIKEVIQLPEGDNYFGTSKGNDIHMMGYPLGLGTPGGGFIYEMAENRLSIGYLTALCYDDPALDPYAMFMRFKRHPFVARIIKGGKVLEQGARTVPTGGYYTLPRLALDGGLLVGACAQLHNTPALKGMHIGIQSGILAAEAVVDALIKEDLTAAGLQGYPDALEQGWIKRELWQGRNCAQALARKGVAKLIHLGAQYFTGGRGFIDPMQLEADADTLKPLAAKAVEPESTESYDGELYVDKLTGIYLSKTMHREDQPSHLSIHDPQVCSDQCYPKYGSPCTSFCPGQVYELELDETSGKAHIKVNATNCLHCKTCDVKDPFNNITWSCPEGGEGPGYSMV